MGIILNITSRDQQPQQNDTEPENNDTNKQYDGDYDDDISIEDESPEDVHVTINDINAVHEMNAGQLIVDPETGEENMENITTPTYTYNLRPRPTKKN